MRSILRFLVALVITLAPAVPGHAADASRELVVQLAAGALGEPARATPLAARPDAFPLAVRARFAALGLHATRALTASRMATAPLAARHALPDVFGFHPERIVLVEAADTALVTAALVTLAHDPLVDWAERNLVRAPAMWSLGPAPDEALEPMTRATLDSLPDDPDLRNGRQYALLNVGPSGFYHGVLRADVHALEAWRMSVGDPRIKLAVADTGIDPDQPELGGTLPDGTPRLVDALNVTDDPDPSVIDLYGHGTPVAGVMAARTGNGAPIALGTGVAGVCGGDGRGNVGCRIVPIKIAPGHSGDATSFDIARALLHAADVGARAMNLSFASDGPSRTERLAMTYALFNGCIPVCAAGNSGFDTPRQPLFPAAYASDGLSDLGRRERPDRSPHAVLVVSDQPRPAGTGRERAHHVHDLSELLRRTLSRLRAGLGHVVRRAACDRCDRPARRGAPDLSDTDFQHVIRESAHDLPPAGRDAPTAWGRLDLQRMLARVAPGVGLWHDEIAADSFVVSGSGLLTVLEGGTGTLAAHLGSTWSTRLAALGTVAIPDSFLSVTSVWLRVAGTMAVRGDFSIPYFSPSAEVVDHDDHHATFRGFVYRLQEDSCATCDNRYVPLPPSSVRFAFSVLGPVDRPPTLTVDPIADLGRPGDALDLAWRVSDPDTVTRLEVAFEPSSGGSVPLATVPGGTTGTRVTLPCLARALTPGMLTITAFDEHGHADRTRVERPFTLLGGPCESPLVAFAVTPSPFVGSLAVRVPGVGRVDVLDAAGRQVRTLATSGGTVMWDGRDAHGGPAAAGLYFVRFTGPGGALVRRVVRLVR
jgi:hypothetical protein